MSRFKIIETGIDDLYVIEPIAFGDARGYFMETYNYKEFCDMGLNMKFVQDNQSRSGKGVLRGLHYQKKYPQGKLVRVIDGEVYDVAVDIRRESSTYGKWFGVTLTADNRRQLYIPPGFAHGFMVLSEKAEFAYKVTDYYHPEDEGGILWSDPDLNIQWRKLGIRDPLLSQKDAILPRLRDIG